MNYERLELIIDSFMRGGMAPAVGEVEDGFDIPEGGYGLYLKFLPAGLLPFA
jgi:hypothetical protein